MQEGQTLIIVDPYERLSLGLMTAKKEKPRSHCVMKYSFQAAGEKRDIFSTCPLKLYGFTKQQHEKLHRCPMEDCKSTGRLCSIMYHLACTHNLKITMIGKMIPFIKNDPRPLPSLSERFSNVVVSNAKLLVFG